MKLRHLTAGLAMTLSLSAQAAVTSTFDTDAEGWTGLAALPFLNWPFFVGPVNGIVVSLVLYVILAKVFPAKKA